MEERQRNFLAATAKRRAEEKQETERLQRLRAAGITDTSEYRPSDWSAPVGADVQAVSELLTVRSAGVAPRCQRSRNGGGCSEADAAQEAAESMAAVRASVAEEELLVAAEVEGDALVVELVGAGLDTEAFARLNNMRECVLDGRALASVCRCPVWVPRGGGALVGGSTCSAPRFIY